MPVFYKDNINDLEELLYNSYVHDSKIENIRYKKDDDSIKIELFNPIFNVKTYLTFCGVEVSLAIKGKEYGNSETIISLTVEKDFSYLHKYLTQYSERIEDSLYLLFQMLSGDELHIVSKEVIVELNPKD